MHSQDTRKPGTFSINSQPAPPRNLDKRILAVVCRAASCRNALQACSHALDEVAGLRIAGPLPASSATVRCDAGPHVCRGGVLCAIRPRSPEFNTHGIRDPGVEGQVDLRASLPRLVS
jgi:hypothetical protein